MTDVVGEAGDMLDRVARAVYEHRKQVMGYGDRERILTFGEATPSRREECFEIARAAIAAMREPTEAMLKAAYDIDIQAMHSPDAERSCWQAMIDTALTG